MAPMLPFGISFRTFTFTEYPGGPEYVVSYSIDENNFLEVTEIQSVTETFPWESTKPGTPDFERLKQDPKFIIGYLNSVSELKQEFIDKDRYDQANAAANLAGEVSADTWNAAQLPDPNTGAVGITTAQIQAPIPTKNPVAPVQQVNILEQITVDSGEFIKSIQPDADPYISLKYPFDALYGKGQDHISIEQFQYSPPQAGYLRDAGFIETITGGLQRQTNLKEYLGTAKLPIPNNLQMSNGINWGGQSANPIEMAAFFSAYGAASNMLKGNIGSAFGNAFTGFGDLMDKVKEGGFKGTEPAGTVLSAFLAQYGLGKLGINVDFNQFLARGIGNVVNPNLELLFSGPKLRNFTFQFVFAPNGVEDAAVARKITRFFKQGMSAKRNTKTGNLLFLGSPNVFRIRYLTDENTVIRGLPRYKICALTTCEMDYSPGAAYQAYADPSAGSQPTQMTMTLSFTELTPVYEDDYRNSDFDMFNQTGNASRIETVEKINDQDVGF